MKAKLNRTEFVCRRQKLAVLWAFCSVILACVLIVFFLPSCHKKSDGPTTPSDIWDIDKQGIPKFVSTNYIDLDSIYRISMFRSSVGHDYSDAFEHCRSMKHYFEPYGWVDWTKIRVYAPVSGTVTRVEQEWAGFKVEIESKDYPAFRFSIFHINLSSPLLVNDLVTEGQQLGTHFSNQTYSDISVIVNDITRQGRMISYFDVITDAVFQKYSARGVGYRSDLIISRELRDANPLTCSGDTFISNDALQNWVVLNK